MSNKPQLADARPMANTLKALATLLPRPGDKATLQRASDLLLHIHDLCLENAFSQAFDEMARQITDRGLNINDALQIARLCQSCALLCEGDAHRVGILLATACDLLLRQHLMLEQANLLPRQEFQRTGSTH
ncbi:MAG TPA: hypothetical protein VD932_03865 [Aquabacterium sp.]|nr:hypothetical protein [Aquabacterium sp.]